MTSNTSDIIMKNLLDGVLIVTQQGQIVYTNLAAEKLFSQSSNELLGQYFGYPVSPFEVQEIELHKGNRLLTVQMLATNIIWNEQMACLISLRDISELKNTTKQLELQKKRLEELNQELEQYASLASHDLKEPVRKLIMFTDRILHSDTTWTAEELKSKVKFIDKLGHHMKHLLNGIAAYSGLSASDRQFHQVNLNEVLEDVKAGLEDVLLEKKAELYFDKLPSIDAIKIQMHQLLFNIISNSIKYAKENTKPVIIIKTQDLDTHIKITVSDNGIGFDNFYADKVFKPFHRLVSRDIEGSGIGLAICKKIVSVHGGSIYVVSKPGKGSDFTFTLEKTHRTENQN